MGIVKVTFYSVECNRCKCLLEDYFGELARMTYSREMAEEMAKEHGFLRTGKNTWICPECRKLEKNKILRPKIDNYLKKEETK